MNVSSVIACVDSARACLVFDGVVHSYADIRRRAGAVRAALIEAGIGRSDTVALLLPNGPEFVAGYLGILSLGAIAVCINPLLTESEQDFMLDDSASFLALAEGALAARLAGLGRRVLDLSAMALTGAPDWQAQEVPDTHPAVIVYSSGTTGRPKGVVLSHGNVAFTARAKVRYMGVEAQDRLLLFLPLHHCFGQNAIMLPAFFAGATLVLQRRFDRAAVLAALRSEGVTMVFGVPTTFLALLDEVDPAACPSVRYWFSAAAPLPLEVEQRWHARTGLPIHQGYGQTECSPFATYNSAPAAHPGRVGVAIEAVDLRIVDPATGADVPRGDVGEVVLRGPNVMLGYWNRPEDTAKAIHDGWLHTGDIGRLDADGFLSVEDRLTDLIIVGGRNVYPAEVENVLYGHPAVAEAAVYGVPDAFLGEEVWADVVVKPGADVAAEALEALCRRTLAPYKVPSAIAFVPALPRNPTGKILKRELRAAAARPVAAVPRDSAPDVDAWVRAWLARHLGVAATDIQPDGAFADYGLDSVLGVALARDLADHLRQPLDPTLVWEVSTLAALLARVRQTNDDAEQTRVASPLNA